MAKVSIELAGDMRSAVEKTVEVLHGAGVAVFPTETVYGIGVASGVADALARLRRLKNRPDGKPFQFLAADAEMARRSLGAVFSGGAEKLAIAFWPGPLTIVVPDGGESSIGVRVPDSAFILEVCRLLGRPIVSSSANPAGLEPPLDAAAADAFGDAVDVLVDGGPIAGGVPSTVVRCIGDGYEILRQGGVGAEEIAFVWDG